MNIYDILLIIILVLVIGSALKKTVDGFLGKNRICSCGGDCSHCQSICNTTKKS